MGYFGRAKPTGGIMKLKVVKLSSVASESTKEDAVLLVAQNKSGNKGVILINPPMPDNVSLGDTVDVELLFSKPRES